MTGSIALESIVLGEVSATRVLEYEGTTRPPQDMFPDLRPEAWETHRSQWAPHFWAPEKGLLRTCVQTWILRSGGVTVLVDTGAGNGKDRPHMPAFDGLDTPFLDRLAAAGVTPADVDVVVNTHLHADHVGWNTRWDNGEWRPTFPNATYLISRTDHDFWHPNAIGRPRMAHLNANVFADSVEPVLRAGQAVLWDDGYHIDGNLRLELAPGHTPGSSIVTLASGGERALFVGDLLHNPVQIVEPTLNSCFCEDPVSARETRVRVLGHAADEGALVFPAHFGGGLAAEVARSGSTFTISRWGFSA